MRKLRKRDPFGVLMQWILTLKDHSTGLVYLTVLPRKRADGVAYKLQEIFSGRNVWVVQMKSMDRLWDFSQSGNYGNLLYLVSAK